MRNECCALATPDIANGSTAKFPIQICANKNSPTFADPNHPTSTFTITCLNLDKWTVLGDKVMNNMLFDNWTRWFTGETSASGYVETPTGATKLLAYSSITATLTLANHIFL